jgi:arylsulfatase A-like enzyme
MNTHENSNHHNVRKQPNLVFVMADQMRGMDMRCAGNTLIRTPHLDRLAEEGFMFRNAVSCLPVCTPQRACLISGRYPTTTQVLNNDMPLPIDEKGFGHVLKSNGYKTGWVGKWHLFGPSCRESYIPPGEHRHGFDDLWAVLNCCHEYFDNYYYLDDSPEKVWFKGYEPDIQTDIAREFISKHKDQPFALFLSWGPPHDPYHQVPEEWKSIYDPLKISFRDNVKPDAELDGSFPGNIPEELIKKLKGIPFGRAFYNAYHQKPADIDWKDLKPDPRGFPDQRVVRDYYAAISALDHNIGRLQDHLTQLNLERNTIFVFTSDHGDMMYSQGAIQKNYPWEESLNVPFLLKYPEAVPPNRTISNPFNTVDILPTILHLMGIKVPDFAEGHSFAPVLKGEDQVYPDAAYIMCPWPWMIPTWRGIRTERYTYVETRDGPFMLYDNLRDPYQLENVLYHPEYRKVTSDLGKIYRRMAQKANDPFESWEVIQDRTERINEEWKQRYIFH